MKELLRHWILALPVLLVVAALGFRQADPYPPTVDEFLSMASAGWLEDGPYSPAEILDSLRAFAPDHMPGYFMLLGAWGSLAGTEIAAGRMLSVFFGLLCLALAYRLGRDCIGSEAGFFALVILASGAFFNMYLSHARMYPMLVFFSAVALWVYLRLIDRRVRAGWRHYIALGLAVLLLASTHAGSAKFLAALGIYHLLFVAKDRRWWQVSAAAVAGVLPLTPWLLEFVPAFADIFEKDWQGRSWEGAGLDALSLLPVYVKVAWNAQALLLLIAAAGVALGCWKRRMTRAPHLFILAIFVAIVALMAQLTNGLRANNMRFLLDGHLLTVLFSATGVYVLYRWRAWLSLLLALWLIAGLIFQASANWRLYVGGREIAFNYPPSHLISRHARAQKQYPILVGDRYNSRILDWARWLDFEYTQRDHYFSRHAIRFDLIENPPGLRSRQFWGSLTAPEVWLIPAASDLRKSEFDALMQERHYEFCGSIQVRHDTTLLRYAHEARECQPLPPAHSEKTTSLRYEFYAAELSADRSSLLVVDSWQPQEGESLESLSISLQILAEDGVKAAQLDRPLAGRGQMRQYFVDVSSLLPGAYKLMAVVYNYSTGERQAWQGQDAAMLDLGGFHIPMP